MKFRSPTAIVIGLLIAASAYFTINLVMISNRIRDRQSELDDRHETLGTLYHGVTFTTGHGWLSLANGTETARDHLAKGEYAEFSTSIGRAQALLIAMPNIITPTQLPQILQLVGPVANTDPLLQLYAGYRIEWNTVMAQVGPGQDPPDPELLKAFDVLIKDARMIGESMPIGMSVLHDGRIDLAFWSLCRSPLSLRLHSRVFPNGCKEFS